MHTPTPESADSHDFPSTGGWHVELQWTDHASIDDIDDAIAFIRPIEGRILSINLDNGGRRLVGKFEVYYLDLELAWQHNMSTYEVFDAMPSTVKFYDGLFDFDDEQSFNPNLVDLFGHESTSCNVLIMNRLEILPEFRGKASGLLVIKTLLQRLGIGAAFACMHVVPLQSTTMPERAKSEWYRSLMLERFDPNLDIATTKLVRYFEKLGFRSLDHSPFMFYSLEVPLPSSTDLEGFARSS